MSLLLELADAARRAYVPQALPQLRTCEISEETPPLQPKPETEPDAPLLAAALAEAQAGTLPKERILLSPGTHAIDPNVWLPRAVARLHHFEQRAAQMQEQRDQYGADRQQEHANSERQHLEVFTQWYQSRKRQLNADEQA